MSHKLIGLVATAFAVVSGVSSAQTLTFIGNSNKNALEYACGEEITFTVSLVDKDANNAPVAGLPLKWTSTVPPRPARRTCSAASPARDASASVRSDSTCSSADEGAAVSP